MTIGLVTDSNAQLPPELADRFAIEVVPLTVTVDGVEYLEGVDLDADDFYSRFEHGASPVVATSQPSPGRFADAYQRLADGGATEILSVHIGSAVSGTVNSARLAAERGAGARSGWSTPALPRSPSPCARGRAPRPSPPGPPSTRRPPPPSG